MIDVDLDPRVRDRPAAPSSVLRAEPVARRPPRRVAAVDAARAMRGRRATPSRRSGPAIGARACACLERRAQRRDHAARSASSSRSRRRDAIRAVHDRGDRDEHDRSAASTRSDERDAARFIAPSYAAAPRARHQVLDLEHRQQRDDLDRRARRRSARTTPPPCRTRRTTPARNAADTSDAHDQRASSTSSIAASRRSPRPTSRAAAPPAPHIAERAERHHLREHRQRPQVQPTRSAAGSGSPSRPRTT